MVYDMDENFQGEFLAAEVRHWPKTGNEVLIPYIKIIRFILLTFDKSETEDKN